jgi:hypothetical protein
MRLCWLEGKAAPSDAIENFLFFFITLISVDNVNGNFWSLLSIVSEVVLG